MFSVEQKNSEFFNSSCHEPDKVLAFIRILKRFSQPLLEYKDHSHDFFFTSYVATLDIRFINFPRLSYSGYQEVVTDVVLLLQIKVEIFLTAFNKV